MPTDWESCYRAGEMPWDKGAPAPPLLEWLEQPGHRLGGEVLVPGCGLGHDVRAIAAADRNHLPRASTPHPTGHDVRAIAAADRNARVVGLDISPAALAQARRQPPVGRESYVEADLFDLPPDLRGRFDWVFEHTCFCAIDPSRRDDYVQAVASALRTGGQLLAIFYLRPWSGGEQPPPGGGPPFPTSREELDRLFSGRFELLEESVPARAYRGREGRELRRLFRKAA